MKDDDQYHRPKKWVGCDVETEYFGDERKVEKAARKQASAKDRSKYKKTDQRKESNQPKEFKGNKDDYQKGRVLSIASQGIIVDVDGVLLNCMLKGVLKKEKTQFKNLVTVGDIVLVDASSSTEGTIVFVEPRRTVLSRAENLSRRKEQLIGANIDQVIITVSVVSPALKPPLIDRYIIAAQKGGMEPIVVINKVDLFQSTDVDLEFLAREMALYEELVSAYPLAGIKVVPMSIVSGEGVDRLKELMKDKASVFSGQSGVGKSSLINEVAGESLRTGDMVKKTNKGAHTTTTAKLLQLPFGGWCIDTPGIKSFGVWDLDKEEIAYYFPEIFEKGRECPYDDCSHLHEEGCAVMAAVDKGEISHLRYESYLSLMLNGEGEKHVRR